MLRGVFGNLPAHECGQKGVFFVDSHHNSPRFYLKAGRNADNNGVQRGSFFHNVDRSVYYYFLGRKLNIVRVIKAQ